MIPHCLVADIADIADIGVLDPLDWKSELHVSNVSRSCGTNMYKLLVGGLEHFFIFPNSWDDDPIWLSYFSEGLKPPTRIAWSE